MARDVFYLMFRGLSVPHLQQGVDEVLQVSVKCF